MTALGLGAGFYGLGGMSVGDTYYTTKYKRIS